MMSPKGKAVLYYLAVIGALYALYHFSFNAGVRHGRDLERIELTGKP